MVYYKEHENKHPFHTLNTLKRTHAIYNTITLKHTSLHWNTTLSSAELVYLFLGHWSSTSNFLLFFYLFIYYYFIHVFILQSMS